MGLSMTSAFSTSPPVSTTMHGTGVRREKPYCRSRVKPGKSATSASRVPVMALKRVDLPTFGRPIKATTGSTSTLRLLRRRCGGGGLGGLGGLFGCFLGRLLGLFGRRRLGRGNRGAGMRGVGSRRRHLPVVVHYHHRI